MVLSVSHDTIAHPVRIQPAARIYQIPRAYCMHWRSRKGVKEAPAMWNKIVAAAG